MRGKGREMHIMNIVNLAKDRSVRIQLLIFQVRVRCVREEGRNLLKDWHSFLNVKREMRIFKGPGKRRAIAYF